MQNVGAKDKAAVQESSAQDAGRSAQESGGANAEYLNPLTVGISGRTVFACSGA